VNRVDILKFMKRALTLAARGKGTSHPNPMVGAVVVADGRIVGEGWHRTPGEPHAEALALEKAGAAARGGSLFVNLEPCDHTGRTPPCTRAIIDAGIADVYAACRDPHPLVDGKGFKALVRAGIRVTTGTLGKEAEELNRAFFHFSQKGTPYVTLKLASTLDGRIADYQGFSKWITGERARSAVHRLRSEVDAVLVGVGTVLKDDPGLDARGVGRKVQPVKIVLDPTLRTPPGASIVRGQSPGSTLLVVGIDVPEERRNTFQDKGVRLLSLPVDNGTFAWSALGRSLAEMGVLHVLAEGGGRTAAWLLKEGAVNRLELFLAPKILGSSGIAAFGDMGTIRLKDAPVLSCRRIRRIGEDIQITADVK